MIARPDLDNFTGVGIKGSLRSIRIALMRRRNRCRPNLRSVPPPGSAGKSPNIYGHI